MDNTARTLSYIQAKPILKWAGGKTQMLNDLLPKVPSSYGRYIEPFFGGGALFFALRPENAIIADSNPDLVNMYRQVANNLDDVIDYLKKYKNTSEMFLSGSCARVDRTSSCGGCCKNNLSQSDVL